MIYFPEKFIAATREYTTMEKHVNAPYFRKKFAIANGKSAKIRICGLGFYELYLNGENITKGRLAPYISNPDEVLFYDDYDVTGVYTDENYSCYYAMRISEKHVDGREFPITADCYKTELDEFCSLLYGGEQKISYRDFIAPVFVMNAINRSLTQNREVKVKKYEL